MRSSVPCAQVPGCPVFEHAIFSHAAWAPFKQAVLEHVAAQTDTQTQSAIVARADNEAIASLGALMTVMCSQVGTLTTAVRGMQRDVDEMPATVEHHVRDALHAALLGAAGAVGGAGVRLRERTEYRAQPPPRAPSPPPTAPAARAMKPYIALGKAGSVKRVYNEYHYGDVDTCGQPLKNMKVQCLRIQI